MCSSSQIIVSCLCELDKLLWGLSRLFRKRRSCASAGLHRCVGAIRQARPVKEERRRSFLPESCVVQANQVLTQSIRKPKVGSESLHLKDLRVTMTRRWKMSKTNTLAVMYFLDMMPVSPSCATLAPKIRVPARKTRRFVMAAKAAAGISSLGSF